MTSGLKTEWDDSGRKGRGGQQKKISKVNEKRKKEKSNKEQKMRKWMDKGETKVERGYPGPTWGVWRR